MGSLPGERRARGAGANPLDVRPESPVFLAPLQPFDPKGRGAASCKLQDGITLEMKGGLQRRWSIEEVTPYGFIDGAGKIRQGLGLRCDTTAIRVIPRRAKPTGLAVLFNDKRQRLHIHILRKANVAPVENKSPLLPS